MSFSRRHFMAGTGTVALSSALPLRGAFAQGAPIKVGVLLDNSGNLDIYGKPMAMASTMAIEELNAGGGLLGRKLDLILYDTQSDIALYTKFAQQLVRQDKVDVVHGGITSASREAKGFRGPCTTERTRPPASTRIRATLPPISVSPTPVALVAQ